MGEPVLSRARPEDAAALTELWKITFGDTEDYIGLFLSRHAPENTLIVRVDGRLAGCTHLLPAELCGKPLLYGYAVAVDPAFRGQGLGRIMQKAVMDEALAGNFAYAVRPADTGLYDMYEKFGMHTAFYEQERIFENLPGSDIKPEPMDAAGYLELRKKYLHERPGTVVWDEAAIAYAIDETVFTGGGVLGFTLENGPAAALFRPDGEDALFVKEVLCHEGDLPQLAAALAAHRGKVRLRVRLPGGDTPSGMLYGAQAPAGAYLNLTLD